MAKTQQGFVYEQNTYKALTSLGVDCQPPAGGSSNAPDIRVTVNRKSFGIELKTEPTAAGSLVLQYYDGKWHFGSFGDDAEKKLMKAIGDEVGILDTMNNGQWKGVVPVLQYKNNKKTYIGAGDQKEAYRIDIAKFGNLGAKDIYEDVPNGNISDYYNAKDTYYLNVGSHGFFLLSKKDPLQLNKQLAKSKLPLIPDFSSSTSAKTKVRVRCQYKSPGYQFVFSLQFNGVKKSPYNIAPIVGTSGVNIGLLKKSPLIALLK